jgi:hypothetical protein
MKRLHPHQYTNAFFRWYQRRYVNRRKRHPFLRHWHCRRAQRRAQYKKIPVLWQRFILVAEMIRQHSAFKNVKLLVNDPDNELDDLIREYFHWLNLKIYPCKTDILLMMGKSEDPFKWEAKHILEGDNYHIGSLNNPNSPRGSNYRLCGFFRCDKAREPRHGKQSHFDEALTAVQSMVSAPNNVLICTGDATFNPHNTFGRFFATNHFYHAPTGPWYTFDVFDSDTSAEIVYNMLREINDKLPPYRPPVRRIPLAQTVPIEKSRPPIEPPDEEMVIDIRDLFVSSW